MSDAAAKGLWQFFLSIPIIGWMVGDALYGRREARYFFAWNVTALLLFGLIFIGYPVVITLALIATATAMGGIIVLTRGR